MPVRLFRRRFLAILGGAVTLGAGLGALKVFELAGREMGQVKVEDELIKLPQPKMKDGLTGEETIERRRSRREYADEPVLLGDISQLCWAVQGITDIYLQAESLGLGTVTIGAFIDDQVRAAISAPPQHTPLYVMPVGHVR